MSKKTIVVVDDESEFLDLAEAALEAEYRVVKVSDSDRAARVCRELRPDAVMLDSFMPATDGAEVLERLAADAATRAIPVVVMSTLRFDSPRRSRLRAHPSVRAVIDKIEGVAGFRRAALAACA